ncbi:HD domain-containing protein [Candidatus Pacearchaeota archaeon]|nr:HD domain-containing protein [Candidatus Pacearchaeota archaeon]
MSKKDAELLDLAIEIAVAAHKGVVDKSGTPYILHPLTVMENLDTPRKKMAGVLHDVVEDTTVTLETLRGLGFPEDVIGMVDSVSRRKDDGETYWEFIGRCAKNLDAIDVKEQDLHHNSSWDRVMLLDPENFLALHRRYGKALIILMTAKKELIEGKK